MAKKPRKKEPPPRPATLTSDQAAKLLRVQYEKGKKLLENRPISSADEKAWKTATLEALVNAFGSDAANVQSFDHIGYWDAYAGGETEKEWEENRAKRVDEGLKMVEGLIELLEATAGLASPKGQMMSENEPGKGVFLVHGHDEAVIHETARFLERLGLEVIVLREQPNEERTIIEKFIDYSDVGFAVVLLTGDDRGGVKAVPYDQQKLRARQNVVLELGFFLGKLGRKRVCALYQNGVEIPSDYSGVLFVPLDPGGGWRLTLAREMKTAGLDIDMNKAL